MMKNAKKITKILLIPICFFGIFGSNNVAFALSSFTVVGDYIPQEDEFYGLNIQNIICDLQDQSGALAIFEDDELYNLTDIIYCDETEHLLKDLTPNKNYVIVNHNYELDCENINEYPAIENNACYISTYYWTSPPLISLTSGVLFGRSGESQQAIQSPSNMVASVGLATAGIFGGVFPYLILSIGVILVFYITQKLAMLTSLKQEKSKKGWTAEGVTEHEINKFKRKKRSRLKRGLDLE